MKATIKKIIDASLRNIGAIGAGEQAEPQEHEDAFFIFQQMFEDWDNQAWLKGFLQEGLFSIPKPGSLVDPTIEPIIDHCDPIEPTPEYRMLQSSYTLGPTGDFVVPRVPMQIETAWWEDTYGTTFFIQRMDNRVWSQQAVKNVISRPQLFYWNRTLPDSTFNFETFPYESDKLGLSMRMPVSALIADKSINDEIEFPEGYVTALRLNLALELAAEYGRDVSPLTVQRARDALNHIKVQNTTVPTMFGPDELVYSGNVVGTYDINSGP